MQTIDLDTLLYGNPVWNEVATFFREGEFHEEHYLVAAIKRHLLTPSHKMSLDVVGYSVEDALNGRIAADHQPAIDQMFAEWNAKLGFHHFGF